MRLAEGRRGLFSRSCSDARNSHGTVIIIFSETNRVPLFIEVRGLRSRILIISLITFYLVTIGVRGRG